MARTTAPLLPATDRLLAALGDRLRLARLRRRLPAAQVAERAGMAPKTLAAIERGAPGATIGGYLSVLQTLQLEGSLAQVAADDPLGRALQDQTGTRRRARRQTPRAHQADALAEAHAHVSTAGQPRDGTAPPGPTVQTEGVSTDTLLALLRSNETAK